MIKPIIFSILITTIVSLVISVTGFYLFDIHIMKGAIVTFLTQIIIFYLWNSIMGLLLRLRETHEETERIKQYTAVGTDVGCAYCGESNYIPVRMDIENNFKCVVCEKENSVYVDITVARTTDIKSTRKSVKVNTNEESVSDDSRE